MRDNLLIEGPEQGVQVFTLNRPEALNALNTELLGNLSRALNDAEADPAVRAVVITSSQKAFAAGGTQWLVRKANDMNLAEGLRFERHAFTVLAGTADRQEGLDAFREKRKPQSKGQ